MSVNNNEKQVNTLLNKLAKNIEKHKSRIFAANENDIKNARASGKNNAFIERLEVTEKTIKGMVHSLHAVVEQPSPLNKVIKEWTVEHNGLEIKRVSCPIGKILIIYESRPNVTLDAFALCFKSGNSCILRGGSESFETSFEIVKIIYQTFDELGLSSTKEHFLQYVQTKDRSAILDLLKKNDEIDLVIPRGGKSLIEFVSGNTAIPVLKHLDGNCHTYVENTAKAKEAIETLVNAKMRRVSVCGATESLVIDEDFAKSHIKEIVNSMPNCEMFGCEKSVALDKRIKLATEQDFYTEYLDAKMSVKIVKDCKEAIEFINKYSSKHTDAILSENPDAIAAFLSEIDSANVIYNASTQFADGFEFGLGAEIGISTGKIHARGPVGLQELVIYKNIVLGRDYKRRA